jgi:hypothetical protein
LGSLAEGMGSWTALYSPGMSREKMAKRLVLLNTSIITTYGTYEFKPISLGDAMALVVEFQQTNRPIESFLSLQETADFLTSLLNFPVIFNRTDYEQALEDLALVFKLRGRVPEKSILTREEMEAMGYAFGLLTRTA